MRIGEMTVPKIHAPETTSRHQSVLHQCFDNFTVRRLYENRTGYSHAALHTDCESARRNGLAITGQVVSITDLSTHPEGYRDEFVEVTGLDGGFYAKPDCSPYFGPPTEWLLLSEVPIYKDNILENNPDRIQVRNTFGGMVSSPSDPSGYTVRNTFLKQAAVWGWVRYYEGPVGCGATDLQGTPMPMDTQQVWYLDAVQLQYLESIEVKR